MQKNKIKALLISFFSLAIGLLVFYCFAYAGKTLSISLKLPLPGIVIGMLFFLMFLHFVKSFFPKLFQVLSDSANTLLPLLPLFILPSCVGILEHLHLIQRDGIKILAALVIGIIITQLVTPFVFFASLKVFKQR